MLKNVLVAVAAAGLLTTAAAPLATARADNKQLIKIVTTSPGVPWNILGAKVAADLNKRLPGVSASGSTGGSTSNIVDVAAGTAEIGWTVNTTALEATNGEGAFKGRAVTNFRVLGPFAVTPLQIITRKGSGIEKLEDLKSKRVGVGQSSWGTTALSLRILDMFGITPDSMRRSGGLFVFTGYDAWQTQMQDGILDAVVYWGGIPSSLTISLLHEPGVEFMPLTDGQIKTVLGNEELKSALLPMTVPAGTYEPIKEDYASFTYASIAIANPDLDEQIAYETLKILLESDAQERVYKDGLSQSLELAKLWIDNNSLPLHPGAERYFREKGLLK